MCQPIISQTTASGDLINHWIHRAEMDDVNLAKNAEDLKKTLTDPATLMTPGLYTCRICARATSGPMQTGRRSRTA